MNIEKLLNLSLEDKQKLALSLFKDKDRIQIFTFVKEHKDDDIQDIKKLLCRKEEEQEDEKNEEQEEEKNEGQEKEQEDTFKISYKFDEKGNIRKVREVRGAIAPKHQSEHPRDTHSNPNLFPYLENTRQWMTPIHERHLRSMRLRPNMFRPGQDGDKLLIEQYINSLKGDKKILAKKM